MHLVFNHESIFLCMVHILPKDSTSTGSRSAGIELAHRHCHAGTNGVFGKNACLIRPKDKTECERAIRDTAPCKWCSHLRVYSQQVLTYFTTEAHLHYDTTV